MAPSIAKQWTVQGKDGFESLKWDEKAPVPSLGDKDVLVKCKLAMLLNSSKSDHFSPRRVFELP